MANFNKVLLIGNLTRDPEPRFTPSGTQVTTFDLAINRTYRTKDGEKKEETCFVTIETWGRQAETCAEYLRKGSSAFVEGRLRFRSWETQTGEKRNKVEVVAERVQFLGGKRVLNRALNRDFNEETVQGKEDSIQEKAPEEPYSEESDEEEKKERAGET